MRPDDEKARLCSFLMDSLARALPDARLAPSIAEMTTEAVQRAGWRPPTEQEMADARAYELLAEVGATKAAVRLGVDRATIYRMSARHQARMPKAA